MSVHAIDAKFAGGSGDALLQAVMEFEKDAGTTDALEHQMVQMEEAVAEAEAAVLNFAEDASA